MKINYTFFSILLVALIIIRVVFSMIYKPSALTISTASILFLPPLVMYGIVVFFVSLSEKYKDDPTKKHFSKLPYYSIALFILISLIAIFSIFGGLNESFGFLIVIGLIVVLNIFIITTVYFLKFLYKHSLFEERINPRSIMLFLLIVLILLFFVKLPKWF